MCPISKLDKWVKAQSAVHEQQYKNHQEYDWKHYRVVKILGRKKEKGEGKRAGAKITLIEQIYFLLSTWWSVWHWRKSPKLPLNY